MELVLFAIDTVEKTERLSLSCAATSHFSVNRQQKKSLTNIASFCYSFKLNYLGMKRAMIYLYIKAKIIIVILMKIRRISQNCESIISQISDLDISSIRQPMSLISVSYVAQR